MSDYGPDAQLEINPVRNETPEAFVLAKTGISNGVKEKVKRMPFFAEASSYAKASEDRSEGNPRKPWRRWMLKIRFIGLGLVLSAFLISTVALKMNGPQLIVMLVSNIVLLGLLAKSSGRLINLFERKDRLLSQVRSYTDDIMNNMNDLLFILDGKDEIVLVNEAGGRMLGYRPEEVAGEVLSKFIPEDNVEKARDVVKRIFREGVVKGVDLNLLTKEKKVLPIILSSSTIKGEDGTLAVILGKDIREVRSLNNNLGRAEKEVKKTYKKLIQTQEQLLKMENLASVGQLVMNMTHEIRNPLTIIGMSAQCLHSNLRPKDSRREFTDVIIKEVESLDKMTRELMGFVQPTKLNLEQVEISGNIDKVLRFVELHCNSQKVEVIKKFKKNLPAILADARRLEQVFLNLIINALQAMPEGGELKADTDFDPEEEKVLIRFTDTGEGIPPDYYKRIFDPFFSLKEDGAGLGLSVSRQIIDDHKGSISLESEVGKGTTFTVSLPISQNVEEKATKDDKEQILKDRA